MRFTITRRPRSKEKTKGTSYIGASLGACLVIWIANTWWPEVLAPLKTFGAPFWTSKGTVTEWLTAVWPIFAWGCGVAFAVGLASNSRYEYSFKRFLRPQEPSAGTILGVGTLISLWAGIMEELSFRWLMYLSGIVGLVFINWLWGTVFVYFILICLSIGLTLLVGSKTSRNNIIPAILTGVACIAGILALAAHGLYINPVKWLYGILFVPLADFTSMGKMHAILYQPQSWAFGAAVVSVNVLFRDGHKYQGWFGWINSWFIGLVFFWTMFTYGLVAAMAVHFTYDFLIFAVAAFMRLVRGFGRPHLRG